MTETQPRTNRMAVFSLISAVLTVVSFCGGVTPIPFTGWFCFPAAILMGLLALGSGLLALRGIHLSGEGGRGLALIGLWTGGLTILATFCAIFLTLTAVAAILQQVLAQLRH